jgi:ATP-dependent Zn protease
MGMCRNLAPIKYVERDGFTGESRLKSGLDELNSKVELEIEKIIKVNYERSKKILKSHWNEVLEISKILVEKETLDVKDIEHLLK